MISIIVSSRKPDVLSAFIANVNETIGVPFEIIPIENSKGALGICRAYNQGASNARYDILCFSHEDVEFETRNWGRNVMKHLSNERIGLIGVAGGDTKGWVPSSWSSSIFPSEVSLIQHHGVGQPPERIVRTGYPGSTAVARPVACVDGVWMCTRKDVFNKVRFDEATFPGFHAYDIDYSLQVSAHYEVCVVFDIMLCHFSPGSFNTEWLLNAIRLSDKWSHKLPHSVRTLERRDLVNQHWTSMRIFIKKLRDLGFGKLYTMKQLLKYSNTKYFHLKHFLHFCKMVMTYDPQRTD
ncbi:MAG: hypothetical protein H7Y31_13495 [Chitinophagaceae bacterium]|nr:hypothetical protein [Chitinophagaceae bacterium]